MKIIPFPGETMGNTPTDKLYKGPVRFTCTVCNANSDINMQNVVFRTITFHCAVCGELYKLSNPALSSRPKRSK